MSKVLQVALDVPIPRLFDYRFPEAATHLVGKRVVVPFGSRKMVGVVVRVSQQSAVSLDKLRDAIRVLDDTPSLPADWFALAEFCSDYYQRPLGEVVVTALPPRLRELTPLPQGHASWTLTEAGRIAASAPAPKRSNERLRVLALLSTGPQTHASLLARGTRAAALLKALQADGLIAPHQAPDPSHAFVPDLELTVQQCAAVDAIRAALGGFVPLLLYGVTGSGKTEVYLHAIDAVLRAGQQALVLVPEINLTPQLAEAFRARFPATRIAVMHSALAANERALGWVDAQTGRIGVVLATRIGVFVPFQRLGLIVVDEEHDSSLKQQDGVRYSARDLAVVRARQLGIPVVLGSATPSLESFANARAGRYRLLRLPERVRAGATLPRIQLVDTRTHPEEHGITGELAQAIRERLGRREQSLVFLNRRGYAPVLACGACGWISDCTRCAAHLVVHYGGPRPGAGSPAALRCHHCGLEARAPRSCPTCGNVDLTAFGRGTQRIEDTIASMFPAARVLRIDSDTTRRKGSWTQMRSAIDAGEVDILIGTQILAKGHDFPKLTLVGILNADAAMMAADYRAPERLFAQLQQVAGRAGRADLPGEVLLQTRFPQAPVYQYLLRNDYSGFAEQQLAERSAAGFPPAVAEAVLRAEASELQAALDFLRSALALMPADRDGVTVFDPVPMSLARLAGWHRAHVLLQAASRRALQRFLATWVGALYATRVPREVRWHVDIDPLEF